VRDFVSMAFKAVDINLEWVGSAENERGIDMNTGKPLVQVNPRFYRPSEVELLIGNPEKARNVLGWEAKTGLEELCRLMVDADVKRNQNGRSF
ncbi:GDP-D-mannose dehydratase, partial [Pseudomonas coronafaciens]